MSTTKILFFSLFVFVGISLISAFTDGQDVKVLLALKEKWSNTPQNWETSNDPCGTPWKGITCDGNNRVTQLNLTSSGLTGNLSDDIGNLTELITLDLSFNRGLTGPLPPSLGNLSKLFGFTFEECSLTGSIPSELGNATQLVVIDLSGNTLTGEIPSSIGKLSNLQWLDLSENQLTGLIPISSSGNLGLDQLKKLLVLDLSENSLTGNISSSINSLTALAYLSATNNNFTGPIPDLTGMVNLSILLLGENSFERSEAPSWISSLQYLKYLDLEGASLYGLVPNGIFSLSQLRTVILKNNELYGTLDMSNIKSQNLTYVDFEDNKISDLKLDPNYNKTLLLAGNTYCDQSPNANKAICQPYRIPVGRVSSNTVLQHMVGLSF